MDKDNLLPTRVGLPEITDSDGPIVSQKGHSHVVEQIMAGPAIVQEVFTRAREAFNADPDTSGIFQDAAVEFGPPVPDPDKILSQ